MLIKLKKRIDSELRSYIKSLDSLYSLKSISPVILTYINEFISRNGKRLPA